MFPIHVDVCILLLLLFLWCWTLHFCIIRRIAICHLLAIKLRMLHFTNVKRTSNYVAIRFSYIVMKCMDHRMAIHHRFNFDLPLSGQMFSFGLEHVWVYSYLFYIYLCRLHNRDHTHSTLKHSFITLPKLANVCTNGIVLQWNDQRQEMYDIIDVHIVHLVHRLQTYKHITRALVRMSQVSQNIWENNNNITDKTLVNRKWVYNSTGHNFPPHWQMITFLIGILW